MVLLSASYIFSRHVLPSIALICFSSFANFDDKNIMNINLDFYDFLPGKSTVQCELKSKTVFSRFCELRC